jgi:hypothetical protein
MRLSGGAAPAVRRRRMRLTARVKREAMEVAPVVRRRDPLTLSSRSFDRPVVLRRLFADHAATAALEDVVSLLSAPSLEEARLLTPRLLDQAGDADSRPELLALCYTALGEGERSAWGDDAAADALQLRLVRSWSEPRPTQLGLAQLLKWAGARLDVPALAKLPPTLARVVTASLAAARGYRGAFLVLALRAPQRQAGSFAAPLSILALRGALEGEFLPAFVPLLLPPARRRHHSADGRDPWAACLLALHAYQEQQTVAGAVHLAAALLAVDLRERLLLFAAKEAAAVLRRRWGSAPPPGSEQDMAGVVELLRSKAELVSGFALTPWPRQWGGPDFAAVAAALQKLLGVRSTTRGLELLLDDRLAVAALFALVGYVPSASALLAQAQVHPALEEACHALEHALHRGHAHDDPALVLKGLPWGAEAERLFQRLRATPEPSVELGSPHWLLGAERGTVMSRLVAEGRSDAARAVRPVLDRPDLRRDLEPFWLLRGTPEDTAAVGELLAWLSTRDRATTIEPAEWLRFAEERCRRQRRPA